MKARVKFLEAIINLLIQLQKKGKTGKQINQAELANNIGKKTNWHNMINKHGEDDVQNQVKL